MLKMKPPVLAALLLASAPAFAALNRCDIAGQVVYQDAPCPSAATTKQVDTTNANLGRESGRWEFDRQKDDMTGAVVCIAQSPEFLVDYSAATGRMTMARLQVFWTVGQRGPLTSVRTTDESPSYHNNRAGAGVKIGQGPFVPFAVTTQHAAGFDYPAAADVAGQLAAGADRAAVRLRFWPYDKLHDAGVTTAGAPQAIAQARRCAAG